MAEISIVVPVYNVQKYIGECLESLVNQTFRDIEIIIVDDGSPDESYKIYEAYAAKDSRIRIVKKQNAGVSEARNTGIDNATAGLIMFADSDDWLELNACEVLYDEYKRTGADLVVADAYTVADGHRHTNRIFDKAFVTEDKQFFTDYQKACIGYGYNPRPADRSNVSGLGSPWNKLYRLDIIRDNNFRYDPYVKGIYDDNLFVLHYLARVKKLSYIPVPVYDYRLVSQSLTQSYKTNTLDISARIFKKIREFIDEYGDWKTFEKPFYMYVVRRLSAELGVYYFSPKSTKSTKESNEELLRMIKTEPYASAIRGVEFGRLMAPHKLTVIGARLGSPALMRAQFTVRRRVRRLLKR